jgi:DNA polymerase I-like protein with 3'-5' exonuclease and polymerase domains
VIEKQKEYIYIDDNDEAEKAVDYLCGFKRLGYDTETTGLKIIGGIDKLLLMQLGTEEVAYLFDPRKINPEILRYPLESPDILKILHNAKFDYQSTKIATGIQLANVFDTMLAYRLLTSGLIEDGKGGFVAAVFRDKNKKQFPYKSLKFLCKKYLGIVLDKDVRRTFSDQRYDKKFTEKQLEYAADDILVLHPLCDILSQSLLEEDLIDTALLEFQFVAPVSEMEINGVQINKKKWRQIINVAEKQAGLCEVEISAIIEPLQEQHTLFGASLVNINSQPQLLDAFQKLGFELESTDSKVLKNCEHELAGHLLHYRAYDKLISTYGDPVLRRINRNTNRLHFNLHQLGTHTGRLSSDKPNIQNIPQDREDQEVKISFRDCFEAPEGNVILTADYSQCELRILAEITQDKKFLEIFRSDKDLHIITAQEVFSFSAEELDAYLKVKKKDKPDVDLSELFSAEEIAAYKRVGDFRDKTKTINFGIVYGLSAWSLADRFKIPQAEAEKILEQYMNTYSGIKRWLNKNGRDSITKRYSRTLIGRKRYYTLPPSDDEEAFRKAKGAIRRMGNNAVIQGTNADIVKEALIHLQKAYNSIEGAKILFTVHDEIVSEVPAAKAEEVAEIKAEIMKQAFHRFIKTVPVGAGDKVSVSIASHWTK